MVSLYFSFFSSIWRLSTAKNIKQSEYIRFVNHFWFAETKQILKVFMCRTFLIKYSLILISSQKNSYNKPYERSIAHETFSIFAVYWKLENRIMYNMYQKLHWGEGGPKMKSMLTRQYNTNVVQAAGRESYFRAGQSMQLNTHTIHNYILLRYGQLFIQLKW